MKELTIYVSDELYGKLLLVPQSERYIVSLIEDDLLGDKTDDSEKLSEVKTTLEFINSRLTAIEEGLGVKKTGVSNAEKSAIPEKADVSSPAYLPDTSSFYRKLAVINGIAVDGNGEPESGFPDALERNILMYVAPGIELKKNILKSLLSIRFPEEDIDNKIRQMVTAGKLCESKAGEDSCVSRE
ncbi:hypothetical protein J2755_001219 [Methanohalophilus levihalophilus]|uniref:hypothetical protein n=1 Tax=Methanohalophilus levihalophilus TaxID=1431282 RepID=UPI001AE12EE2|nr:hypothetical protein [Methanohalophilus levihalophilus]MBP2030285.1 hypothetical protein [Methanohalophilus levihalophilus]